MLSKVYTENISSIFINKLTKYKINIFFSSFTGYVQRVDHSQKFRTKVGGAYFCYAPAHMIAFQESWRVNGSSVKVNALVKPKWRRFRKGIF